MLSTIASLVFL
jgi:hypothetical protein